MANARIDRMLRELQSDPSQQFFSGLFGLMGLGKEVTQTRGDSRDAAIPVSLLKTAPAR